MSKLISKLVAIKSAAHIHENRRDFVQLLCVATANLERPVKGKERKDVNAEIFKDEIHINENSSRVCAM